MYDRWLPNAQKTKEIWLKIALSKTETYQWLKKTKPEINYIECFRNGVTREEWEYVNDQQARGSNQKGCGYQKKEECWKWIRR